MASVLETLPLGMLVIVTLIKVYYLVFALFAVVGGIMGYVKAKSAISLVAGTVSGVLLVAASFMLPAPHPTRAYVIGLLVSVLLAGKFVPDFVHKKAVVPGGLMAVLSLAGIVLTLLAWYGK
jgi:uncharacterized membrane protein (UPF0136 family)